MMRKTTLMLMAIGLFLAGILVPTSAQAQSAIASAVGMAAASGAEKTTNPSGCVDCSLCSQN